MGRGFEIFTLSRKCRKAGCIKECNKYLLQLSIQTSWKFYLCSFYDNVTFLGNLTNSSINSEEWLQAACINFQKQGPHQDQQKYHLTI